MDSRFSLSREIVAVGGENPKFTASFFCDGATCRRKDNVKRRCTTTNVSVFNRKITSVSARVTSEMVSIT